MHSLVNLFTNHTAKYRYFLKCLFIGLFLLPSVLYAATDLNLVPSSDSIEEGRTFTVNIYVKNNAQAINAVSGALTFPTELLSVVSLSKEGSIVKLWAEEPSYSNANGTIKFEGVILNPGYSGSSGKVLAVTFLSKKPGTASVLFGSGQVLANDGEATNVARNLDGGEYALIKRSTVEIEKPATPVSDTGNSTKPIIVSSTHPNENAWYSSRNVAFSWNVPSTVTAVRTLYDTTESSVPTKVYTPPVGEKTFVADEDGAQYMHVQFKDKSGWGPVTHFRFQIDSVTPTKVMATLLDDSVITSPKPQVQILTSDALSGLQSIGISIDGNATTTYEITASSLYTLPGAVPGKHTAFIEAKDRAGNVSGTSLSYTITTIDTPKIREYTKYAEKGDVIKVTGDTYPLSQVEVVLINTKTDEMIADKVQSKDDGSFEYFITKTIPVGVYEMKARVIDRTGAESSFTEAHVIEVENQSLIRIGMFIMNWLSLLLIIILAAALIIATLWYSFLQFTRFRRKIHRTMKEAEDALRVNVAALRRDTEEFHSILQKAEKKRELTKEEQSILKKFKKRLDTTEKEIEKKLEQIR